MCHDSRAVEAAFRQCLYEYIYDTPHPILDMHLQVTAHLQGTAHSSEEIKTQGVMI